MILCPHDERCVKCRLMQLQWVSNMGEYYQKLYFNFSTANEVVLV